ncbi:MAG: hypothetical protein LBC82_08245 [Oscillospiraceae bacterium]|jgi:hypothetical protein|nr:hypothetical protein [Oscillospiraceae bacterium]
MEEIKAAEFSPEYFPSEIPPIFRTAQIKESKKPRGGVVLYRLFAAALIIIALIVLKVFFPDIYVVIDSWLNEKLALSPLTP